MCPRSSVRAIATGREYTFSKLVRGIDYDAKLLSYSVMLGADPVRPAVRASSAGAGMRPLNNNNTAARLLRVRLKSLSHTYQAGYF